MALFDSARESMEILGGDRARSPHSAVRQGIMDDPERERGKGLASHTSLDHAKTTAVVRFEDRLLEADVYALPGEPVKVVILCPRCGNASQIDGAKKAIEWTPKAPDQIGSFINAGELSIEPFECAWELPDAGMFNPDAHKNVIGTAPLCRLKIGITKNYARRA